MKKIFIFLTTILLFSCGNSTNQSVENKVTNTDFDSINEKTFIELGGEKQYVEMTGVSDDLPVLLFLHGGPGWPQTPHLRYFNADLTKEMIVVSWDQAGCGKSYLHNPNPKNLSPESLINDAHKLTQYLKKKFKTQKIFLLGFSYGSVIGLQLAEKYPEDYNAYIGVSQVISAKENWDISMKWLKEQAESRNDKSTLDQIKLIEKRDPSVCKTDQECFMNKYLLLVKYNGTIYKKEIADEIAKAETFYSDYKEYDWMGVYNYTSSRLGGTQFQTDLTGINALNLPVYFMAGKYDWNLPGEVAEKYLKALDAPKKEFIWFENSGHEPPEEEPKEFNNQIIKIVKELSR